MLHLLRSSISKEWRQRSAHAAMSFLVAWHTLAMLIASSPDSTITEAARGVLRPYMTLFRLDNHWGFFSPDIGAGSQFRYIVEDAGGKRHAFVPADTLNRFHPSSIWIRDRYELVMEFPERYGNSTAATLCAEHASLNPVSVTLIGVRQKEFWPHDRRSGKTPFDAEFIELRTLKTVRCAAQ
jgi:hypothetical protein